MRQIKRFIRDARAATAIEYALIAALISVSIVVGATAIGTSISTKFYGPVSNALS
jgi:pilus assembly protein Flp/PilA